MSLLQAIQQGVQDISTKVTDLDHKIDLQNVKLFGSEEGETPGGRLIRLETDLKITNARVDSLQTASTKNGAIIGIISGTAAIVLTVLGQWLFHIKM